MQDVAFGTATDLTHMVHKAKGRRFVDVLEDLIGESCIRPKTRIYSDVGMKQDTFSAIRRGKYSTISRENVFRICVGLRLNYDNATMLMKSCGIIFREEPYLIFKNAIPINCKALDSIKKSSALHLIYSHHSYCKSYYINFLLC